MALSISRTMKDSFSRDEIFLVLVQQNAMICFSRSLREMRFHFSSGGGIGRRARLRI